MKVQIRKPKVATNKYITATTRVPQLEYPYLHTRFPTNFNNDDRNPKSVLNSTLNPTFVPLSGFATASSIAQPGGFRRAFCRKQAGA